MIGWGGESMQSLTSLIHLLGSEGREQCIASTKENMFVDGVVEPRCPHADVAVASTIVQ
jgi:hypothetical protein